jgi:hypothetical protein
MSEQASLPQFVPDTRRLHDSDGDGVAVVISETTPARTGLLSDKTPDASQTSPDRSEAATAEAPIAPVAPKRRRGGRWFPAFCALLALLAAAVALAAPTLRPVIATAADTWFGGGNLVSRMLAPSPALEAGWRQAREEAMQALNAHLADYTARIDRLATAQQATAADVARAAADLRADHTTSEALSRAVDELSRQTKELRQVTAGVDGRVRATGLLTLALRLRRDVDAGLPIGRDVSALAVAGPYPAAIDRSLQQLRHINNGVPTMRDLADEFDGVMARLSARSDATTSWASRGWTRLGMLFGGTVPAGGARFIDHLRALASDGRFSEAADEIQASTDSDLGAAWIARVRARATAVVAIQALLAYSLVAYENAFATAASEAGGR